MLLGKSLYGDPMTIGSLRGEITVKEDNEMIIEVNGVGYRLQVTTSTYETACIGPAETQFFVHHHFRENEQTLYGFPTRFECSLFELLISAHKVGPALGLAILSTHDPEQLIDIVNSQDIDALCLVPGVGKTTASRLLIDLDAKFKKLSLSSANLPSKRNGTISSDIKDVRDALSGLGYGAEEIYAVTKDLPSETETSELIKLALQKLAINSK
ncbi:MAG: Holliday junction branch migration protein RuvA [Actinobacteria bacterium]|nr:Holliday junction branch migration protein RuvA [Actinomycetota bacterium]MBD29404.1 Holliday junction branch migration protein RuvA [Acidimicrobiaceae bacterium]